jgi:hypothetical protein
MTIGILKRGMLQNLRAIGWNLPDNPGYRLPLHSFDVEESK